MCLSKAYVVRDGKRELLMEEVALVKIENGKLLFRTLFGEQKELRASIREINLMEHTIFLEDLKEGAAKDKRSG